MTQLAITMYTFENLLKKLQLEGLSLEQAEQSRYAEVRNAMMERENRDIIARYLKIREYLKPYPIVIVTNNMMAKAISQKLTRFPSLGLDIETEKTVEHPQAGLIPKLSRIRLVQMFDGQRIVIFDCKAIGDLQWMHTFKDHHMIAHNATFEAQHFFHAGITFSKLDCTMLEGRVFLNKNLSLKDAAKEMFGLEIDKTLQVSDWSSENLLPEQIQYAALDAVITFQLHQLVNGWFLEYPHYLETYQFLKALIYPLVRQQSQGILVDIQEHLRILEEWKLREKKCLVALKADGLQKPGSILQVQAFLRQKLSAEQLEDWPRTKSGNLKSDSDTLSRLEGHETLGLLGEYATLRSRLANFGTKLQDLMVEGQLYPSYQIAGMVTGRFGCSNPNIQNQPRQGFKHIYVAPEDWQFVTGDLSQVELRVAGLISEDIVINDAYARGQDLHRIMAAKMTGKLETEITKEERTAAKGVNFGLLFGGGAGGLKDYVRASYGVGMTLEEAEHAKATFHRTYPQFSLWQKLIVKHTNQHDESESTLCRLTRHYGQEDHFRNGKYRDIYTQAINYPIQSTAWELLALAICYVDAHLPADGSIRISHHVYDELCLCARDDQVKTAALLLYAAFEHAYKTVFPGCNVNGIIEIGAGKNWTLAGNADSVIALNDNDNHL